MNWHRIRSWEGSQRAAFEQLCCGLARLEPSRGGAVFTRNGRPDGGVECYWTAPTGEVTAWQAKFFPDRLTDPQWRQIEESIETALEAYPTLETFYMCVPQDLPNQGVKRGSARRKWESIQEKWTRNAAQRGMTVRLEWCGADELSTHLIEERNAGLMRFWFNEGAFSDVWYQTRLARVVRLVGSRYRPKLDVDLEVRMTLEGLAYSAGYLEHLSRLVANAKRQAYGLSLRNACIIASDQVAALEQAVTALLPALSGHLPGAPWRPQTADLLALIALGQEGTRELDDALYGATSTMQPGGMRHDIGFDVHTLRRFSSSLVELSALLDAPPTIAAERCGLVLEGEAGAGKTHLFCEVASDLRQAGHPVVLVLGEAVSGPGRAWQQLLQALDLGGTSVDQFLGALQAHALASGRRALLLIDAVNEGDHTAWRAGLKEIVADVQRYDGVAVGISVRTTFTGALVDSGLQSQLAHDRHPGFEGAEDASIAKYFPHFGLKVPGTPLMLPEFTNPLFLTLFCSAMKNLGRTEVPAGLGGFSAVLDLLRDGAEARIAALCGYEARQSRARLALNDIAAAMVDAGRAVLPFHDAEGICDKRLPNQPYVRSLFRGLLSEGLLREVDTWDRDSPNQIAFTYERVGDYLRAQILCSGLHSLTDWRAAFQPGGRLESVIPSGPFDGLNLGLLEALALLAPERAGVELPDVFDDPPEQVWLAFIHSVVWRSPSACGERTSELFELLFDSWADTHDSLLNAVLQLAPRVDHPLNGEWLHQRLMALPMPRRDARWSVWLFQNYQWNNVDGGGGTIRRAVSWAWDTAPCQELEDRDVWPLALLLSWFLTTSHRPLRDRTTKALVALLVPHLSLVDRLVATFRYVDDPYVLERVLAVAYGTALRSDDDDAVGALAQHVYRQLFESGRPPDHVLIREYARGVVEVAEHRGTLPAEVDLAMVWHPYTSDWTFEPPSLDDLRKRFTVDGADWPDDSYRSVTGFDGDFGLYVLGTNSWRFPFEARLRTQPPGPTVEHMVTHWLSHLTESQQEQFATVRRLASMPRVAPWWVKRISDGPIYEATKDLTEQELVEFCEQVQRSWDEERDQFEQGLGRELAITYGAVVRPWLERREGSAAETAHRRCSPDLIQSAVLAEVLALGWTPTLFRVFDSGVRSRGRSANKPERMGKKYQWIAWHRVMARAADNLAPLFGDDERSDQTPDQLTRGWISRRRDIDPSCLLRTTAEKQTMAWWSPVKYDNGRDAMLGTTSWLRDADELPDAVALIDLRDPDGDRWLALDARPEWRELEPPGEEGRVPVRRLTYRIQGYIVRRRHAKKVFDWAMSPDDQGRHTPEVQESAVGPMVGEYWWAEAYRRERGDWPDEESDYHGQPLPAPMICSSHWYLGEHSTHDCSVDDTIHLSLPSRWLARCLGLRHGRREGEYVDSAGVVQMMDPSAHEEGPGALLVRASCLTTIRSSGYDIVWIVTAEKIETVWGLSQRGNTGFGHFAGAYRLVYSTWRGGLVSTGADEMDE